MICRLLVGISPIARQRPAEIFCQANKGGAACLPQAQSAPSKPPAKTQPVSSIKIPGVSADRLKQLQALKAKGK